MDTIGQVLLADDEDMFSDRTATLLRGAGYACTCVTDARSAIEKLHNSSYDLLIAGTDLPGNEDLRLLRELSRLTEGVPAILVTDSPSLESAMQALQFPVMAYLIKPCDASDLLEQVERAIAYAHTHQAIQSSRQRVQAWSREVERIETAIQSMPRNVTAVPVSMFFMLSLANITGTLVDLQHLMEAVVLGENKHDACHLLGCPRPAELTNAVREVISVLEATKTSFKSRALRDLRQKLDRLI